MKINAYILAADPAYAIESVRSYYSIVHKIVVSYDRNALGWHGLPIPVEACLKKLRDADPAGKIQYLPDDFCCPGRSGVEGETYQRRVSLEAASEGADWVLQLDSDEVMADPKTFLQCLRAAEQSNCAAMEYPLRWLFAEAKNGYFLEASSRLWQPMASYPGAMAVKSGTALSLCRQTQANTFRVDFRSRNTDPWHAQNTPVHKVISPASSIWHFCMVRGEEEMLQRSKWHTHAKDFDWTPKLKQWFWAKRHPLLAVVSSPFRRKRDWVNHRVLRLTKVKLPESIYATTSRDAQPAVVTE